jgi:hypothetical protein
MRTHLAFGSIAAVILTSSLAAAFQPPARPAAEEIAPSLKLGMRVRQVQAKLAVAPVVVIVRDTTSYVEAVGMWRLTVRFPVLIDDGTPNARENIARFVRGFKPEKVLRYASKTPDRSNGVADPAAVESAVGRAWSMAPATETKTFDRAAVIAEWKALQLTPPGVVVAAVDDPAWTAALALSAGRGQPIFWTASTRRLDAAFTVAEVEKLEKSIETFAEGTGYSWKGLGDDLEAVTLCTAMQQTIAGTAVGVMATTDRIGRQAPGPKRWAWGSQISGSTAGSAYRAMTALFLPTTAKDAWIFDSYPDSPGWNAYAGKATEDALKALGWSVKGVRTPSGGIDAWRQEIAKPIDATMIFVNTKGEKHQFHLASGTGTLADVPFLNVPSVVNFVHSYSAQFVGTRETLAGRWLDRGAAGYVGSVDEPQLSGFVPTPAVAARLAAGIPLAAAARYDDAPPHKITIIGDALWTLGGIAIPKAPPAAIPSMEGAVDLSEEVKGLIRSDLAEGVWLLVMLGRDADASRLAAALATTEAGQWNAAAAVAGASSLFRTGRANELRTLVKRIPKDQLAKHPEILEMAR